MEELSLTPGSLSPFSSRAELTSNKRKRQTETEKMVSEQAVPILKGRQENTKKVKLEGESNLIPPKQEPAAFLQMFFSLIDLWDVQCHTPNSDNVDEFIIIYKNICAYAAENLIQPAAKTIIRKNAIEVLRDKAYSYFQVGEETVSVCTLDLACGRSPFFRKVLEEDRKGPVPLDCKGEIFREIAKFLESPQDYRPPTSFLNNADDDEAQDSIDFLAELLEKAHDYGLRKLCRLCERGFQTLINKENAEEYYVYATKRQRPILQRMALDYFSDWGFEVSPAHPYELKIEPAFFRHMDSFPKVKVRRLDVSSCHCVNVPIPTRPGFKQTHMSLPFLIIDKFPLLAKAFPKIKHLTLPLTSRTMSQLQPDDLAPFIKLRSIAFDLRTITCVADPSENEAVKKYDDELKFILSRPEFCKALSKYRLKFLFTSVNNDELWPRWKTVKEMCRLFSATIEEMYFPKHGPFEQWITLEELPNLKSLSVPAGVFKSQFPQLTSFPNLTFLEIEGGNILRMNHSETTLPLVIFFEDRFNQKMILEGNGIEELVWKPYTDWKKDFDVPRNFVFLFEFPYLKKLTVVEPILEETQQLIDILPLLIDFKELTLRTSDIELKDTLIELILKVPDGIKVAITDSGLVKTIKQWSECSTVTMEEYLKIKQTLVKNKINQIG